MQLINRFHFINIFVIWLSFKCVEQQCICICSYVCKYILYMCVESNLIMIMFLFFQLNHHCHTKRQHKHHLVSFVIWSNHKGNDNSISNIANKELNTYICTFSKYVYMTLCGGGWYAGLYFFCFSFNDYFVADWKEVSKRVTCVGRGIWAKRLTDFMPIIVFVFCCIQQLLPMPHTHSLTGVISSFGSEVIRRNQLMER